MSSVNSIDGCTRDGTAEHSCELDDYDRQHALGIQLKDEDQLPPVTTRTRSVSLSQRAELMVVEELSVDSQAPNAILALQCRGRTSALAMRRTLCSLSCALTALLP